MCGFSFGGCGGSYESDEDYECQKCLEEGHKKKIKVNANSNEEICDAINRLKK